VDAGYARKVRLDELDALEPPARADHRQDYARIFQPGRVQDVLDREILPLLQREGTAEPAPAPAQATATIAE
jgi:hypothetical protein